MLAQRIRGEQSPMLGGQQPAALPITNQQSLQATVEKTVSQRPRWDMGQGGQSAWKRKTTKSKRGQDQATQLQKEMVVSTFRRTKPNTIDTVFN